MPLYGLACMSFIFQLFDLSFFLYLLFEFRFFFDTSKTSSQISLFTFPVVTALVNSKVVIGSLQRGLELPFIPISSFRNSMRVTRLSVFPWRFSAFF